MTPEREARFREVIRKRQLDLAVVLENVHDPHNIGAVLRSCDAVGIQSIYILYTEPELQAEDITPGMRSSRGARKWVDVYRYHDPDRCLKEVRRRYGRILATRAEAGDPTIWESDLTQPAAFVFGNERDGVSPELLARADGVVTVPQAGMAKSLNISVACAVTIYEVFRQRALAGVYNADVREDHAEMSALYENFVARHRRGGSQGQLIWRTDPESDFNY